MNASKVSEARKAFILTQSADGVPVAEICRTSGISQATCFKRNKKYDGMLPQMRSLRPAFWRNPSAIDGTSIKCTNSCPEAKQTDDTRSLHRDPFRDRSPHHPGSHGWCEWG